MTAAAIEIPRRHRSSPQCPCTSCLKEFPRELTVPRGDRRGLDELLASIAIAAPIAPAAAATPASRFQQLERELAELLEAAAPATWKEHRAAFWRFTRGARRELRS